VNVLSQLLLAQAGNNAWANHRLYVACAQLSQADFEAKRVSFFPSLKATLNHILTVDWYYIDAIRRSLAGEPPNLGFEAFWTPQEPFSTCAELRAAQSKSDHELLAICRGLDDATLQRVIVDVPRRTGIEPEPLPRLLSHVFVHQVHHRGQAHAMLSGTGVAPPQLDEFYLAGDAPRRVTDFAQMGFAESQFWQPGPAAE
jgi:uncharacterized damage-inducible protein DinB